MRGLRLYTMISHSSIKSSPRSLALPSFNSPFSSVPSFSIRPKFRSFISWRVNFLGNSIFSSNRSLSVAARSMAGDEFEGSSPFQHYCSNVLQIGKYYATWHWCSMDLPREVILYFRDDSFFRSVLRSMETIYLNRNPTAKAVLELVHSVDNDRICYDHFAFRTFGVNGHGIDSMAKIFLDFGYSQREELGFPAKKLKALWFSPPASVDPEGGTGINGPLPRIFISELLVDQMSAEAQEIIRKYTEMSMGGSKHAALASALGSLTWEKPSFPEFQQLARESEYAAWTLVNGYALNHVTISAHQLRSHLRNISSLNRFIEENGFKLNSEGGTLKVSPDGLLLQSSTVADSISFQFSGGITESVPCSYIEFAERLVLPQYKDLPTEEVEEFHRRDGFEVGNADKIFESTSMDQLARRAA